MRMVTTVKINTGEQTQLFDCRAVEPSKIS